MTTLKCGSRYTRGDSGMCMMEYVAHLAGETVTDAPACCCPALARFARALNDGMGRGADGDALRGRYLLELAPRMVGTRDARLVERREAILSIEVS